MKKLFSVILAAVMTAAALVSCSGSKNDDHSDFLTQRYNYDLSEYVEVNYKGIPAEGYHYEVTEELMNEQINATLANYARLNEVTDRGAKMGDTVIIDYMGTVDGVEFYGGSVENFQFVLGLDTFPAEFEKAIVGAAADSSISVDFKLPTPYNAAPEYSGMDAHFDITLHHIYTTEMPEYNSEFVRGYLGYESIEIFEAELRKQLEEYYKSVHYNHVIGQIWDTVFEQANVKKLPEKEIKDICDSNYDAVRYEAESQGINFEDYIKVIYNLTEEEFKETLRAEAEDVVRDEMICYAIVRAENVVLTHEEYTKRALGYATDFYNLDSLEAFEELFSRDEIYNSIICDMAREIAADYADITYLN